MPPRKPILTSQKASLRAYKKLYPNASQKDLREWFEAKYRHSLSSGSISDILSNKYNHLDEDSSYPRESKRQRRENWPELERALSEWIRHTESAIPISQEVIREKGKQYWPSLYPDKEMPSFSNGWLHGFQSRRNIKQNIQHGEARSLSGDASTEMVSIRQALSNYRPQDIYNCDETGLYWRLIPDKSLSTQSIPGQNKNKARISLLFCCNSDASDKVPLWFIGTSKRPKTFAASGINIENLGCVWKSNRRAWMTGDIFKEWLLWFEHKMTGRKVVLLMDNFSAHEAALKEIEPRLQNTLVIWLPCNSTTQCQYQPLEQGIIQTWKAYWRQQWVLFMMAEYDRGYNPISTMTILLAVRWAISAWNLDLKESTIQNYFQKALTSQDNGEVGCQETIMEISYRIQQLEVSNNIQDAMDINQFLNPAEEQVNDSWMNVDEIILSQHASTSTAEEMEEDKEDNGEPLPHIPVQDALESLYKLRLFEEQQIDGNRPLIQQLLCHERALLRKNASNQQQRDIRSFFCT